MARTTWDGVEALAALDRWGTVSEAATRLRLTQSGVSKRLKALQAEVGVPLVQADGRRLVLTAEGLDLLARARPLLAGMRELATPRRPGPTTFSLALADSIAASWGPRVVAAAVDRLGGDVKIELHAHRTVLLLESVRLGRYQLGLAPEMPATPDLFAHPLVDEPIVWVRGGRRGGPLITIEESSATWRAIEAPLRRHHAELLAEPLTRVESFAAVLQMVRAGFGDGLVPLGLVREAKLPPRSWSHLDGVHRSVSLVCRKTTGQLARFAELAAELRFAARRALLASA